MSNPAASFAIQRNEIQRAEAPLKTECFKHWNLTEYEVNTTVKYSSGICRRYCLQKDIADTCDYYHPNLFQHGLESTFGKSPCLITPGGNDSDCFSKVILNHEPCTCNEACNETEFLTTISTTKWPSDQYWVSHYLASNPYRNSSS